MNDRIDEFNERLENIVGIKPANILVTVAQQQADDFCIRYGVSPGSTEHYAMLYQNLLDGVLKHYEERQ